MTGVRWWLAVPAILAVGLASPAAMAQGVTNINDADLDDDTPIVRPQELRKLGSVRQRAPGSWMMDYAQQSYSAWKARAADDAQFPFEPDGQPIPTRELPEPEDGFFKQLWKDVLASALDQLAVAIAGLNLFEDLADLENLDLDAVNELLESTAE